MYSGLINAFLNGLINLLLNVLTYLLISYQKKIMKTRKKCIYFFLFELIFNLIINSRTNLVYYLGKEKLLIKWWQLNLKLFIN